MTEETLSLIPESVNLIQAIASKLSSDLGCPIQVGVIGVDWDLTVSGYKFEDGNEIAACVAVVMSDDAGGHAAVLALAQIPVLINALFEAAARAAS